MTEGPNPFAPPAAEWEQKAEHATDWTDFVDAKQGTRFANLLIDYVVQVGMMIALIIAFGENAAVTVAITVGYYVFFEALFSRTPAKWITRTRVIGYGGGKPRFWQIVGRSLARCVPFEPFSFLGNERGWHDRWSGTRVVKDRRPSGAPFPS